MKITRKTLEEKVGVLNKLSGQDFTLGYAREYGGYCLESRDGARRHSPRISAQQLWWFLAGQIEVYDRQVREEALQRRDELFESDGHDGREDFT